MYEKGSFFDRLIYNVGRSAKMEGCTYIESSHRYAQTGTKNGQAR